MRVILGKGRINLRETTTRVASQTARAKQHNESSYKSSKILTRSIQPLQDVLDLQSSNENILHSISSCLPFGLTTSPRISSSGDKDSGLSKRPVDNGFIKRTGSRPCFDYRKIASRTMELSEGMSEGETTQNSPVRKLASLIGKIVATANSDFPARLHSRALLRNRKRSLKLKG
uniref:Uncharacterized protein n=1 Tax=Rhizophagus irregularis (strain DAOM 181602 / DAOM 197198 / MUCL 43194) TaxID=747089 RepID=U9UTG9_RHIID